MQAVVLKSSCDSCTASKVKCSGGAQCDRCKAKGIACFYSPRKKRGPPKKRVRNKTLVPNALAMNKTVDPNAALNALGIHEKRSWSVFFTLYKHYGTSCSRFWFNRQLNKMRTYLGKQDNKDALKRLTSWMEALNIDVDDMQAQMARCIMSIHKEAVENARRQAQAQASLSGPMLHIKGELKELQVNEQSEVQMLVQEIHERTDVPYLKVVTGLDSDNENSGVEVNPAFTELFGYNATNIEAQLHWTGGGFLPWGGDILSRLLTDEKDLLAYVQLMSIKFNNVGKPEVLPTVREVPSCHRFPVSIGKDDNLENSKGKKVDCLIKCVHREVLAVDRSYMEMYFTFHPLNTNKPKPAAGTPVSNQLKRKLESMLPNLTPQTPTFESTLDLDNTNDFSEFESPQDATASNKRQLVSDDNAFDFLDSELDLKTEPVDDIIDIPNPTNNIQVKTLDTGMDSPGFDYSTVDGSFELPLEDSSSVSDQDATEDADFVKMEEIDGQWLDSLLDWVKAE